MCSSDLTRGRLADLAGLGLVRELPGNWWRRIGADWVSKGMEPAEVRGIHAALLAVMPTDGPQRLAHAAAAGLDVTGEAIAASRSYAQRGRFAAAAAALASGLLLVRGQARSRRGVAERTLLVELAIVALAQNTPVDLEQALYELGRAADAALSGVAQLLRAAREAFRGPGPLVLDHVAGLSLGDPRLERWRREVMVRVAVRSAEPTRSALIRECVEWASRATDPDTLARGRVWEGNEAYRRGA